MKFHWGGRATSVRSARSATVHLLVQSAAAFGLATAALAQQSNTELFEELLRDMDDVQGGRRDEAAERWRSQGAAARENAMHAASRDGNVAEIRTLLAVGTNPNAAVFGTGSTPLHTAACNCQLDMVNVLLAAGARTDVADRHGNIALHYAAGDDAGEGDFDECALGQVNFDQFDGRCAAVIDSLLRNGADPNRANKYGESPLHFAARESGERAVDRVRRLLDAGSNANRPNSARNTPLHAALGPESSGKDIDVVAALVRAGADPNAGNQKGDSALLRWIRYGGNRDQLTLILLDAGADPDGRTQNGDSALHLAVKEGGQSDLQSDTVTALLNAGADPCVRDAGGYTPYHLSKAQSRHVLGLADGFDQASPSSSGCPLPGESTAEEEAEERARMLAASRERQRDARDVLEEEQAESVEASAKDKRQSGPFGLVFWGSREISANNIYHFDEWPDDPGKYCRRLRLPSSQVCHTFIYSHIALPPGVSEWELYDVWSSSFDDGASGAVFARSRCVAATVTSERLADGSIRYSRHLEAGASEEALRRDAAKEYYPTEITHLDCLPK